MVRQRITFASSLLLILLLLAGCGSNGTSNSSAQPSNNNGASSTNQSVTASTEQGLDEEQAEAPQHRIVSTTVAITEVLDALELDVVGVPTTVKELPERYEEAVEVGNPMSPDMELVKSLKPTHVLSVTTLEYDLEKLFERVNIDASYLDFTSLDAMKEEIRKLGEMFDRQSQAEALIASYDEKISNIKAEVEGQPAPTVLILMGIPGSYLVATENSYIGDLVKQLGGNNIVTDSTVEFVASNTEYLHQGNPDVILRAAHGMPDEVIEMFDEEFRTNDIWKNFNAVKNGRVYDLPEDFFGTTGNLAADEALDLMADFLYPDRKG